MIRRRALVSWLLALAAAGPARADPPVPAPAAAAVPPALQRYSRYERESIEAALAAHGAAVDEAPEGKLIEAVDVVSLDVIEPRDPAPLLLNDLHVKSRRAVIAREVLLRPGDRYQQFFVDETARNLRDLFQLSLVVCLPVKGGSPGRVRLLVLTKDVWSLRLNSDFRVVAGRLEYLLLQPSEINVAGTQQTVGLQYIREPLSQSFGGFYLVPRFLGSRVAVDLEGSLTFNLETGRREGEYGLLDVERPLFSARERWAWSVSAGGRDEITRRYVDGVLDTFDATATPGDDRIPYEYRTEIRAAAASLTRSFGFWSKNDLSLGVETSRRRYRVPELAGADPAAVEEFKEKALPIGETRIGPFVGYHGYTSRFLQTLDVETLGLQEDIRLGHEVTAKLYPVLGALGSSRDILGAQLAAQDTLPLGGDGFARGAVQGTVEEEAGEVSDASFECDARVMSPRTRAGRVLLDGQLLARPRNHLNRLSYLGGDGRLRGYPSKFFLGKDLVSVTLEYRTRAVEALSVEWAAAVFLDNADAPDSLAAMSLKHGAGAGLRALFPQLQRMVLRLDFGVPLAAGGRPPGVHPVEYILTFGQAFPLGSI